MGLRVFSLLSTLLVASIVIYGAMYLAPGDPAAIIAGAHASHAAVAAISREYHLNDPVYVGYWYWLRGVLHGNFGQSFVYHEAVTPLIEARVGTTLLLIACASFLIVVGGIALGVVGGLSERAGGVVTAITSIGFGVPSYVAATIMITFFAVDLGWFPTFGAGTGLPDELYHMVLPAIALAASWTALVAQMTKTAVRQQRSSEHVDTAISRGLRRPLVIRRHIMRNAMLPVTTAAGLTVAGLIAGDVIVEQAFGLGGIGSFLLSSVQNKDLPVVQALSLLLVTIFVVINTLVDVVNRFLDPRIAGAREA